MITKYFLRESLFDFLHAKKYISYKLYDILWFFFNGVCNNMLITFLYDRKTHDIVIIAKI